MSRAPLSPALLYAHGWHFSVTAEGHLFTRVGDDVPGFTQHELWEYINSHPYEVVPLEDQPTRNIVQ